MSVRKKVLMLLSLYDTATHRGIARVSRELGWQLNLNSIDPLLLPKRMAKPSALFAYNDIDAAWLHSTSTTFLT